MILIIGSKIDNASKNIFKHLISATDFKEKSHNFYVGENFYIKMIDSYLIYAEDIDEVIKTEEKVDFEEIIFISRHKSETERECLTVHPVGNIGKALYGGKDNTLVHSSPVTMFQILHYLYSIYRDIVSYECTHHGPHVRTRTTFVEIGSGEPSWSREEFGENIAYSILSLSDNKYNASEIYVGIGGGHYAPRFTELSIKYNIAFGHMISRYQLENLSAELLKEAVLKTPGCEGICIHRKSLSSETRKFVLELIKSVNIPYVEK